MLALSKTICYFMLAQKVISVQWKTPGISLGYHYIARMFWGCWTVARSDPGSTRAAAGRAGVVSEFIRGDTFLLHEISH